jgi:hypothetical protein
MLDLDADHVGHGGRVDKVDGGEQYSLSSSSSQFFMKMPTTSWPCFLRR